MLTTANSRDDLGHVTLKSWAACAKVKPHARMVCPDPRALRCSRWPMFCRPERPAPAPTMTEIASTQPQFAATVPPWQRFAAPALAGVVLVAVAASSGGYFATSWGWAALAFGWAAVLVFVASGAAALARGKLVYVGALGAFAGWVALSWIWTPNGSQTWLEVLRDLVYPLGVAAVLLLARARGVGALVGAILAAISLISLCALATRLFPDRLGQFDPVAGYRLAAPLGYWNALGIFSAIGVLLALGLAARARPVGRALAAASLLVLVPTIYFTFSRGSWLALAIGIVFAVAVDPRRLQLLATIAVLAPAPAVAVLLASRSHALTRQQTDVAAAAPDGHRLAAVCVGLAFVSAAAALLLRYLEHRVALAPKTTRGLNALLAVGVVGVLAVGLVAAGGPARVVERAHDAFTAPPPRTNGNLNQRLFSFSGTGRSILWRAAWNDYKAHPLLGSGAGSYEQYWLEHRSQALKVRDAHNLYLETLAELGPIGLALLLVALATPLVALRRARRHPLVPALAGAYVAYLAHAAVDWDWEMLAVTLAALFCGAGILIAARDGEPRSISNRVRIGGVAAIVVLIAVALVGLVGNINLSRAGTAARAGDWEAAADHARAARTWAPWSSQPYQQLGEAQLLVGDTRAAQDSFRKAIDKSPNDWNLWFDLARATTSKAQLAALTHAKRLNPLSPEIAQFERELAAQGAITLGK
jgi:tetratricopeptide (TPR) repeat protein